MCIEEAISFDIQSNVVNFQSFHLAKSEDRGPFRHHRRHWARLQKSQWYHFFWGCHLETEEQALD